MTEWPEKRKVMQRYDDSAKVYDNQYAEEQKRKMNAILMNLDLEKSSLALDVGCGTGILFSIIEGEIDSLVGIDTSPEILKIAKEKSKSFSRVSIVRADADLLPFREGIFDIIFLVTLLQNMPDPMLTLRNLIWVGKKRTIYVITGIKKFFSKEEFVELLKESGLDVSLIVIDNDLKGIISICQKR